jgi:hypothetical protein
LILRSTRSATRRFARASIYLLPLALLPAVASPASAQSAVECRDGRVVQIVIDNHSVFDLNDANRGGRFAWAYRLANSLHVRTRQDVVQRELLFSVGDCYDVGLLRDSERLLRAFAFIANASIYGVRIAEGEYRVIVDTQDEWSTRVEPRIQSSGGMGMRGLRLVEDNLVGTGRRLAVFYDTDEDQTIYGFTYATPHMFKTRWNMGIQLARTEVGTSMSQAVAYPFVGEIGRYAFRQTLSRDERYFELFMAETDGELSRVWVPVRREFLEAGAAIRWGNQRNRHTIFGAAIAAETVGYPEEATFADVRESGSAGFTPEEMADSEMDWTPVSSIRLMMMGAQRNVYFIRRNGLDTVNGTEDVQLGVEAEASFGPTLPVVSTDRDVAVGLGLYAAGEVGENSLAGGRFTFEGRRSYQSHPGLPEWNDVLAELDLWAYLRPDPLSRHLVVLSLSALGGWHGRVPFQLTLGGDAGLRGYPRHVDPGGRRIVGSAEYRARLGWPMAELFDLGTVAFLDVGRIWPGHVPFGTKSPVRTTAGLGIRAAFPPGSTQTFRLDVGVPIERTGIGWSGFVVNVGVGQVIGRGGVRRDPQLLRSARYNLEASDFVSPGVRP